MDKDHSTVGAARNPPGGTERQGPLEIEPAQMRAFGYAVVDAIVEHHATRDDGPVVLSTGHRTLRPFLQARLEGSPSPWSEVLHEVCEVILGNLVRQDHTRYLATVPASGVFAGAMAEALSAGFQVFTGNHTEAQGPTEVELTVIDWLRSACGLPSETAGLLVSGGSVANMHALAAARAACPAASSSGAVAYCSDQTHSSVERAFALLGFAPDQLRRLPTGPLHRLDPETVRGAISEDLVRGHAPFMLIANAGATNTGIVDPLAQFADVAREHELWFHVDGAYGAAAMLSDRLSPLLAGIERADSVTLDPHKWLFQPFGLGCVLVRDPSMLGKAFRLVPEYLEDYVSDDRAHVNFYDLGIELTRPFRGLRLWMTLRVHGQAALTSAIEHGAEIAERTERRLERSAAWQVVTGASLGIVTFQSRRCPEQQRASVHARVVDELRREGIAMVTATRLGTTPVLRLCTINPRLTDHDVCAVLERMDEIVVRATSADMSSAKSIVDSTSALPPRHGQDPGPDGSWPGSTS